MLVSRVGKLNNQQWKKRELESTPTYSHPHYSSQILHDNSNLKPSKVAQTTFKGFLNSDVVKVLSSKTDKIPSKLSEFTFKTLEKLGEKQAEMYNKIADDFVETVKNDSGFRKKLGISDSISKNISRENLIQLPKKSPLRNFIETIISPVTSLINLYKPIVKSTIGKKIFPNAYQKLMKEQQYEGLVKKYSGFIGLSNSIKIWENGYRQFSGNPHWSEADNFLIPDDILIGKIRRRRPKVYDSEKGKYSTKSLMLGNRLTSGMIYSVFLSTDAYNTTMKYSQNKEESSRQQKSRFVQENARIGLNLYLQNIIFSTFESKMNKSIFNALLASGSTVALSEIIGRQLVSKPIIPSDKKTLDELEQKMMTKKGFLPALGRMMTRVKKAPECKKANPFTSNLQSQTLPKPFGSFMAASKVDSKQGVNNSQVAFKGLQKIPQAFESKNLNKMLEIINEFDPEQYKYYKSTIENGFDLVKKFADKQISGLQLQEALEKLEFIPIGEKMTLEGKLAHSVLAPADWFKAAQKSLSKTFRNLAPVAKREKMINFVKANNLESEYAETLRKRLSEPAWLQSGLGEIEKQDKILEEFIENKNKIKEEIQGVKNVMLWLEKQVKSNKIDINNLSVAQKEDLFKMLEKATISSDGAKQLEYDGNTLAQWNIHLARAITTIFLVTDAYNLAMQYSNDNRKEANKSARGRAVQEAARISISAYMLGFVHNLLSKVCNSSLAGAFTVTAITSLINDSLARKIVGVPLTRQCAEDKKKA